eukprot:gnl/MRDRNA2_/MRDRNA2_37326_c0_seq2.p1 gnl/MRDRNA2_/MRDRNA2_37326_c0~~gnl/MRDRNA2_/MRDRNA2_37326_c0_seq2.p1  ORF type:complete len:402 (+),score=93.33 gnl/MRDRNA2_/MRDRNA2_37326_c0_seq2:81-1286(+)
MNDLRSYHFAGLLVVVAGAFVAYGTRELKQSLSLTPDTNKWTALYSSGQLTAAEVKTKGTEKVGKKDMNESIPKVITTSSHRDVIDLAQVSGPENTSAIDTNRSIAKDDSAKHAAKCNRHNKKDGEATAGEFASLGAGEPKKENDRRTGTRAVKRQAQAKRRDGKATQSLMVAEDELQVAPELQDDTLLTNPDGKATGSRKRNRANRQEQLGNADVDAQNAGLQEDIIDSTQRTISGLLVSVLPSLFQSRKAVRGGMLLLGTLIVCIIIVLMSGARKMPLLHAARRAESGAETCSLDCRRQEVNSQASASKDDSRTDDAQSDAQPGSRSNEILKSAMRNAFAQDKAKSGTVERTSGDCKKGALKEIDEKASRVPMLIPAVKYDEYSAVVMQNGMATQIAFK